MTRKLFFLYVLGMLLSSIGGHAQIRVVVADPAGHPLPYVNSILIDEASNFSILGQSGDEFGVVQYEGLRTGSYKLLLLYLGYETDTISDIFIDEESPLPVDFGIRRLQPRSNLLDVVDIIAQAPLIIRNNDGLTYNIERTTLASGEDALSLLNHVPGVMINGSNEIMVNGKRDVIILLDGRQQYIGADELGNLLRTLSSETIKQVEVRNSASSRYDAAAGSAVINIVRKKASYAGISGSISVRYRQERYGTAFTTANLDWKRKKFSGGLYYNFSYYQGFHDIESYRIVDGLGAGGSDLYFRETIDENWTNVSHSPRVRLFYDMNEHHRLGIEGDLIRQSVDFPNENTTEISNDGGNPDSLIHSSIVNDEQKWFPSASISYSGLYGDKSALLDISYDFFYYDYEKFSAFHNQKTSPSGTPLGAARIFRETNPLLNPVHTASLNFSKSAGREHFFDLGAKVTFLDKQSETLFENLVNGGYVEDDARSRSSDYKEHIFAGYINWAKDFQQNWTVEMGTRVEHTRIEQSFTNPDTLYRRDYVDVFPFVRFSKTSEKNVFVSLSYARKLQRPSFNQLNPFILVINPYLVSSGDPGLDPQVNNAVDFEISFPKNVSLYAGYLLANNSINSVFLQEGDGVYNLTYQNFDRSHFANAGLSVQAAMNDWWKVNIDGNLAYDVYNTKIDDDPIQRRSASVNFSVNNIFTMPKAFIFELYGTFESPRYSSIEYYKSTGRLDVSLTKYLFDRSLTIKIKGRDLFYTSKYDSRLEYAGQQLEYLEKSGSRRFELSVSYTFKKGQKVKPGAVPASNAEEKQRTN